MKDNGSDNDRRTYQRARLKEGKLHAIALELRVNGAADVQVHGTVAWCKPHAPEGAGGYRVGVILDKGNLSRNLDFFVALGQLNIGLK